MERTIAAFITTKAIEERPLISSVENLEIIPVTYDGCRVGASHFFATKEQWGINNKIYRKYCLAKVFQRRSDESISYFHNRILKSMRKELNRGLDKNNIKCGYHNTRKIYEKLEQERREKYYRSVILGE